MYLFSYAASNEEANELHAEYHLGRLAFSTKQCACTSSAIYAAYIEEVDDVCWSTTCMGRLAYRL